MWGKRRTRWYLGVVSPLVASSGSCCSSAHWNTRKSIARGVVNILSMHAARFFSAAFARHKIVDIAERLFIAKCCLQEWAAHALLTVLTLRSRFSHALLTLWGRCLFWWGNHRKHMHPKAQLSGCRPLEAEFQIWSNCVGTTSAPLTTLGWSGVATPLPQPEICATFLLSPKDPESTSIWWYYDMFLFSPKDPKSTQSQLCWTWSFWVHFLRDRPQKVVP